MAMGDGLSFMSLQAMIVVNSKKIFLIWYHPWLSYPQLCKTYFSAHILLNVSLRVLLYFTLKKNQCD